MPEPLDRTPTPLLRSREIPSYELTSALRAELIARRAHGVYCAAPDPNLSHWEVTRQIALDQVHAVADGLRDDLVVTGAHAALLLGAPVQRLPDAVDVAGPGRPATTRGPRFFVRHERDLDQDHVVEVDGIRVTSPARTALECGRLLPPDVSLAVADSLLGAAAKEGRWNLTADRPAGEQVRRAALRTLDEERGFKGNPRARAVLTYADARAETLIESELRRVALVVGLPRPQLQVPVTVAGGRTYYPDLTWRFRLANGQTVVIHLEADGHSKYVEGLDLDAERVRTHLIEAQGDVVVRMSTRQIRRGGVETLRRLLAPHLPPEVVRALTPVHGLRLPHEGAVPRRRPVR